MNWQDDPSLKAAAFEGIASNRAIPPAGRLQAAIQAAELLRAHLEQVEAERDLLGRQHQALLDLCVNAELSDRLIHHEQVYQLLTTDPGDAT